MYIVIPLLMGGIAAYIAKVRGRNPIVWFFLGIFFKLLGIIVLLLLPIVKVSRTSFGVHPQEHVTTIETEVTEITPSASTSEKTMDIKSKEWYWLNAKHEQNGPISFFTLKEKWQKGSITSTTYVWAEGMREWRCIKAVPELLQALF